MNQPSKSMNLLHHMIAIACNPFGMMAYLALGFVGWALLT